MYAAEIGVTRRLRDWIAIKSFLRVAGDFIYLPFFVRLDGALFVECRTSQPEGVLSQTIRSCPSAVRSPGLRGSLFASRAFPPSAFAPQESPLPVGTGPAASASQIPTTSMLPARSVAIHYFSSGSSLSWPTTRLSRPRGPGPLLWRFTVQVECHALLVIFSAI